MIADANDVCGTLRARCAYMSCDSPVEIVTKDRELREILNTTSTELSVVRFYPDTVDAKGKWGSCFKIEVELRHTGNESTPHELLRAQVKAAAERLLGAARKLDGDAHRKAQTEWGTGAFLREVANNLTTALNNTERILNASE